MKKKLFLTAVAVIMAFALMGCSVSSTVTKTESHTDANGNTTTTTTTTTTQNGSKTESSSTVVEEAPKPEQTVATIAFRNDCEVDIYGMFFSSAQSEDWGEDILGDNAPLENGETITYHDTFRYTPDDLLWDLVIADANGETLEFDGLNLANAENPVEIRIVLSYDAEGQTFTATVE